MNIEQSRKTADSHDWRGSRARAQARLDEFLPEVDRYAAIRNFSLPGNHGVSRLSPYLRHRLISEEEVISRVTSSTSFDAAEKFIQEVVWRTYWKGALHRTPSLWSSYESSAQSLSESSAAAAWGPLYEQARAGTTHLHCFNDWVHELTTTGYLHNHIRMWFASIWIFTFKIPWQLGAALMYEHLLDGDPASNTLSWRWVAGLHTKGKTYLARADNIAKYSEGRWAPQESDLATEAFSVSDEPTQTWHEALRLPVANSASPAALLVTIDDLSLETVLDTRRYPSVCLYDPPSPHGSPMKQSFIAEGVSDFTSRIAAARGTNEDIRATSIESVKSWLKDRRLRAVEIAAPQVGPLLRPTQELASSLISDEYQVSAIQRTWDTVLFPLCDKGFFTMWERFKKRWASKLDLSGASSASTL